MYGKKRGYGKKSNSYRSKYKSRGRGNKSPRRKAIRRYGSSRGGIRL